MEGNSPVSKIEKESTKTQNIWLQNNTFTIGSVKFPSDVQAHSAGVCYEHIYDTITPIGHLDFHNVELAASEKPSMGLQFTQHGSPMCFYADA